MPNRFRSQFGENALKYFVDDCCGYSCSFMKFPFGSTSNPDAFWDAVSSRAKEDVNLPAKFSAC